METAVRGGAAAREGGARQSWSRQEGAAFDVLAAERIFQGFDIGPMIFSIGQESKFLGPSGATTLK